MTWAMCSVICIYCMKGNVWELKWQDMEQEKKMGSGQHDTWTPSAHRWRSPRGESLWALLGWNCFRRKVLRSLSAHCSSKVYVSDVNTVHWGNVTSVCNWLPLNRGNTIGSLETRCCFQSNRGQASLARVCLHLPIPSSAKNMQGNFAGVIIVLAHVPLFLVCGIAATSLE